MNVLLVSAHDDTKSFVASLHNTALGVFERTDDKVLVSDLYAQQFNPVASMLDFKIKSSSHVNYMFEQQRAANTRDGFSPDLQAEMEKLKQADLLVVHFPLWWGSTPAVLKGWFERVFAMGFAWDSNNRFDKGLLKAKKVLLTISVGDPESFYSKDGLHKATVEQHLYSLTHGTLAYCGLDVYKPFIIHNVTAGSDEDLEKKVEDYRLMLQDIKSYNEYLYKH